MKRKILAVVTCAFALVVLPLRAYAAGGYMAISGEKTYHVSYCEELEGAEYNKLKWFDTQKQAESAGLSPCELCEADDWFDFEELDGSYFITNDHKLDAALDAALEYGAYASYESGYEEGYGDGTVGFADEDVYNAGYEEGYSVGYKKGKEEFSDATYSAGFNEEYEKSKSEKDEQIAEMEKSYEEEPESAKSDTPWFEIIVTAVVAVFIGNYISSKKHNEKFCELETKLKSQEETMKIMRLLAERVGSSTEQLASTLYVNFRKTDGVNEAQAKAELYDNKLKRNN